MLGVATKDEADVAGSKIGGDIGNSFGQELIGAQVGVGINGTGAKKVPTGSWSRLAAATATSSAGLSNPRCERCIQ